jgi:hypothetical protein
MDEIDTRISEVKGLISVHLQCGKIHIENNTRRQKYRLES